MSIELQLWKAPDQIANALMKYPIGLIWSMSTSNEYKWKDIICNTFRLVYIIKGASGVAMIIICLPALLKTTQLLLLLPGKS